MLPFFHNSQCFEKKVRKELEAIGFLDPVNENNQVHIKCPLCLLLIRLLYFNFQSFQDDSDEVLSELKRCQEELQSIAFKNKTFLTNLLQTAKTEYKRQQIKTQIKNINNEVSVFLKLTLNLAVKKIYIRVIN